MRSAFRLYMVQLRLQGCSFTGLSLTAADAGNNNIRVAGPTQLKSFLHTTRHFMKLPDGLLNFHTTTKQSSCIFNSSEVDLRMISFDCHYANGNGSSQRNCFVGRTPELKGKFDLQKAQALNVPKGPLFGKYFQVLSYFYCCEVPTVLR